MKPPPPLSRREKILAELPRMKIDLDYALQTMKTVTGWIEEELKGVLHEIRARFEEAGRPIRTVRAAHTGNNQTPIVYVDPEEPFGTTPEEKGLLAWLDEFTREKTGVGARVALGRTGE
jgi:hypothetical protein